MLWVEKDKLLPNGVYKVTLFFSYPCPPTLFPAQSNPTRDYFRGPVSRLRDCILAESISALPKAERILPLYYIQGREIMLG